MTEIRLLILGNSNSQRPHGAMKAWPDLAVEDVERATGVRLAVTHRNLYAQADGAAEYAATQVEKYDPEIAIIAGSCTAAALPTVARTLEDRVGTRLAAPVLRVVSRLDWVALNGGRPGAVAYRAAHGLGMRVLGGRFVISMDALLANYDAVLGQLARFEGVQFLVCSTNRYGPRLRVQYPHTVPAVFEFNREMKRMTESRHFGWIDRDATVCAPGWEKAFEVDGVHMTALGERRMADAVVPVLEEAVRRHVRG